MTRRSFFKRLLGLALAPVAASVASVAAAIGIEPFGWVHISRYAGQRVQLDQWACFVHPDAERDIRTMAAKDAWRYAHRAWKKAGKPELTAHEILRKYGTSNPLAFGRMISMRSAG